MHIEALLQYLLKEADRPPRKEADRPPRKGKLAKVIPNPFIMGYV